MHGNYIDSHANIQWDYIDSAGMNGYYVETARMHGQF